MPLNLFHFAVQTARAEFQHAMTTSIGTVHLHPHRVSVPDPEFGTDRCYPGTLVWSELLHRDVGELWRTDGGIAWREVNDRKRSDLLTYGHARDEYDAIRAVVRQAEQG